jgi:2-C-methyl-D-erythritol 2,4-cyclodiphosphate synthase
VRIGQGVDAHRLVAGRRLILGGVEIPFDRGLEGHSDGDVLLHAVASALLGALGQGDLGEHFPSSDATLAGIASREILQRVVERVTAAGFAIGNVDATVIAQVPRLAPHRAAMTRSLADALGSDVGRVSVKVTSTDRLGFLGREEGVAALAVVLIGDPEECR